MNHTTDLFGILSATTAIKYPAVGRTPSGHLKLHAEMSPADLVHLIGYDPRAIAPPKRVLKTPARLPANVAESVINLQRDVQRSIDQSRVDMMVEYLYRAVSQGGIADWAEIDVVTSTTPDLNDYTVRFVVNMPTSAAYFITDGQHRYAALLDFLRRYPREAATFTQPIAITVIPEDDLTVYAGQSFHDKNYLRAPVKVAKALATDTRDAYNQLAKDLATHPVIAEAGGVDMTRDTLPPKSKAFTTHGVLYRFVRAFVVGRKGLDKGQIEADNLDDARADLWIYFDALGQMFPHWHTEPTERDQYLSRSSAALQALAVVGHDLWSLDLPNDQRAGMLAKISERRLDWRKSNVATWDGVIGAVGSGGAIAAQSSRPAIDGTIAFLRRTSGLAPMLLEASRSAQNEAPAPEPVPATPEPDVSIPARGRRSSAPPTTR
jgi:DGQHR domain-containing protein